MKTKYVLLLVIVLLATHAHAQMWNGQDTLYGNEWINYDQSYFKIPIAEDGIYRLSTEVMEAAGIPLNQIQSNQLQLFHLGEEQALYASNNGILTNGDYIEFYGEKNRSEVDRYLFESIDSSMLNPWYSLITDTAVYYLTWSNNGASGLRYETINNDLTDVPPKEEWYWAKSELFYTNDLRKIYTKVSGASVYYSRYGGEGFASDYAEQHDLNLPSPGFYSLGPESLLNLRFVSNANDDGHNLEVRWNNVLIATETYNGAQIRSYNINLNTSSLNLSNSIQLRGLNNNDSYAIGGAAIRYPRIFNADGATFFPIELPEATTERYLELDAVGGGTQACFLYDQTNLLRLEAVNEDGVWKAKFPAATSERHLIAFTDVQTVSSIQSVEFVDLTASEGEYLILTSEKLRDNGQGTDYVQQYADYRNTAIGGAYNVKIVNVETLYDQYAYGVERHPIAIRNFVHLAQKEWQNLKYCFLIGKGQEYNAIRNQTDLEAAINEGFFYLPSYGWPASDNLMFAFPGENIPSLPIGRIAVINGEEIGGYLGKVQAMEANLNNSQTIEDRAWMKNVLHLGGGSSASEQSTIRAYMEGMAAEITRNEYGGNVKAFYKTTSEPIQSTLSDQIFNTINEGTSIITFFGHSSPGTFDFNIDNPDNYINANKYPLMLSLGCYSGNIFVSGRSIGERFTFYENKATVAFGASRGLGFISSLGGFARSYYANLGGEYYGEGIGDALKATLEDYSTQPFIGTSTLVEQFTLHGDPAIQLYPSQHPDFVIDPTSVSFTPAIVSATQDSFSLQIDVLNIGKNIGDTVLLTINRLYPNGIEKEVIRDTIRVAQFRQSFSYKLPTEGREGVGLNIFKAQVDVNDVVFELSENNNRLEVAGNEGVRLFIVDNSARPIYPVNFSVVNGDSITLKASSTNVLASERTYLLELDTTALFNSPLYHSTSITQDGGVINWTPTVEWIDGTAYFWRISPDSTNADIGYTWEESTFTYIESSEDGWRQGGNWQFWDGRETGVQYDSTNTFSFSNEGFFITLKLKNYDDEQDPPAYIYNFQGAAGSVRPWNFMDEGIGVVVGDSITGAGWINPSGGNYGSVNSETSSTRVFAFPTESFDSRANLINFLDQIIPPSSYVILFTVLNTDTSSLGVEKWALDSVSLGTNLFTLLESEGAIAVRNLEQLGSVHYGIMYQKGKGLLTEGIASSLDETLSVEAYVPIDGYEGIYTSPLFGNAKEWKNIYYHFDHTEPNDSIGVNLIGVTRVGEEVELLSGINSGQDISQINPEEFPGIKLSMYARDLENRTSPQLRYWAVDGQLSPDIGINPLREYSFYADTLQKGEHLRLSYFIEPIIGTITDSMLVNYSITNANNQVVSITKWLANGVGAQGESDSLEVDASALSTGDNNLLVEVNLPNGHIEQTYFNNRLNLPFYVKSDQKNPILDVTFDGRKIIDGDIVSPEPVIVIRLVDENEFLLLEDSSAFALKLITHEGNTNNIALDDEAVTFIPATDTKQNEASVIYRPTFDESGIYRLRVQGEDASGNVAGQYDYEVSFEVILENSISNVFNYPNPFSTSTQFVYTLTGEQPAYYALQIMTVSGRVVKEISGAELGSLEIGTHKTEYAWDGTDDYGDRLANGVYLYRFIARDEKGEPYEKYERNTDRLFKNGIGKLVILR